VEEEGIGAPPSVVESPPALPFLVLVLLLLPPLPLLLLPSADVAPEASF